MCVVGVLSCRRLLGSEGAGPLFPDCCGEGGQRPSLPALQYKAFPGRGILALNLPLMQGLALPPRSQTSHQPLAMELLGNTLPRMNWDSPALAEEWSRFKQQAELLFRGPFSASKEDEKCCYLLIWVGDKGREIFKTWPDMSAEEQSRLDAYYARFDEWVAGRVNPVFARVKFYERRQGPGEPLDQFVADLIQLAGNCCFPDTETMVRDRMVCGIYLHEVRQKLIDEGMQLSLKRALDIARICEMTHGRLEDVYRSSPFGDYKPPWLKRKAMERAALELSTPAESCDESGSSHETEEVQDFSETEQMDQDTNLILIPMSFEDVVIHFSEKEWDMLQPFQKQLYKEVMLENYNLLVSIGYDIPKPDILSMIEEGKEPCCMSMERSCVFVPTDDSITETFLLSLIVNDDDDISIPGADDDHDSTDDSADLQDDPEPIWSNGAVIAQKKSKDSTVIVGEMTLNGQQYSVTMNCIATKPVANEREQNLKSFSVVKEILGQVTALTSGRNSIRTMENQLMVNGMASPASPQLMAASYLNSLTRSEQPNAYSMEACSNPKEDSTQQQFKPFNNSFGHAQRFHLETEAPPLLHIKQEVAVDNGPEISTQSKHFIPLNVNIKEEIDAVPICDETSQASTDFSIPSLSQERKGRPSKLSGSEKSSHSDAEDTMGDMLEESSPSECSASEKDAAVSRKRKSHSEGAEAKNEGPRKRGPKPRNLEGAIPNALDDLSDPRGQLAVQKIYKCTKCPRTFSHYSRFVAHMRSEMRKKVNQRTEPAKQPNRQLRATTREKSEKSQLEEKSSVEKSSPASTHLRSTRTTRATEVIKDKENDSSQASQQEGQRLRERKTYTCNTCKKNFTSKSSMVVRKGDNDEEVYSCSHCEEADGEANPQGAKYECNVCPQIFSHKTGLTAHLRIHSGDKPHKCTECEQTFSFKSALIVHQRRHKKEKVPEKVQELKKTIATIAPTPVMAPKSVTAPNVNSTTAPVTSVGKMYTCPQCKEEFANSTLLFTHQQTHTGPKPHACTICDKSFNDKALLVVHLKTHTGESPYQCGKCQKTFTSQSLLVAHGLTHSSGKPFQCNLCDKSFNGESLLKSHLRTHTGEKSYQCTKCKDTFPSDTLLHEHQKIHLEERPHKCDYCEKGFNSQQLLVAHRRIHTGEKAFHCHYCGEGFNTSSLLNVHLRNHAPEKPYPCDLCERSFNLKSLLQAHRATHEVDQ